jgi:hypothetical protein
MNYPFRYLVLDIIKNLITALTTNAAPMPTPVQIKLSSKTSALIRSTAKGKKNWVTAKSTVLPLNLPLVTEPVNLDSNQNWIVPDTAPIINPNNVNQPRLSTLLAKGMQLTII